MRIKRGNIQNIMMDALKKIQKKKIYIIIYKMNTKIINTEYNLIVMRKIK